MSVRVGMSGFSFSSWVGDFYPDGTRAKGMLPYYGTQFDTVELNTTFYRTPKPAAVTSWRSAVPDTFQFAVKAPRWAPYIPEAFREFVDRVDGLGPALGPILFQAPKGARYDESRLRALLETLPDGPCALEAREPSFAQASGLLREFGVALCLNDDDSDPFAFEPTAAIVYMRFRHERYEPSELDKRARLLEKLAAGRDVYVYFRHQESPACALQALDFRRRVT